MTTALSALLLAGLIWWFSVGPGAKAGQKLSPLARKALGIGAGVLAAFVMMRGRIDLGIVLGSLSAWMLGVRTMLPPMFDPFAPRRARVTTPVLDLSVEAATGAAEGTVRQGPHRGRTLASLTPKELFELAGQLVRDGDLRGLGLIEADLDRRAPGWRQHVQADAHARSREARASVMSAQEAYQVLGLQPGAGEAEIRHAHRALIGKIHPDRGGSDHLAALVNQAKEVLMAHLSRRHG